MAERTVSVGLLANVNNYVANMGKAEAATKKLASTAVGSEKSLRAQGEAFTNLGKVAMVGGAVAAAGLALVVKASTEYGAKMAQLQSLSHASAADMKRLSDAAMTVGTAYGYSATQVADAEIELTKAGVSVSQQLGGALKGALSLAAAGQLDVAQATEITTVAMTQFGLSAKDVPQVADELAAGADKALGSVGDLGEALKNGGLQAHNMGLTINDTIGLLSGFANAGILGAEAGTQMRSMFLRLENPTSAAKKTLDEYGISINDASGKFVGISKFAGELRDNLSKLDPATRNAALATIFGSHAIVGATAIYNLGAKGVQGWIDKVNAAGFANAQAAGKMNSLQGDVQKLSAAFQTDLIKAGSGASSSLRGVTQAGTNLLNFLGDLPQPLQDAGMEMTTLVAGVGLLGGAALVAVPKVLAFKTAMSDAGVSAKGFAKTVGPGGAIIIGLSAIAAGFSAMGTVGTANTQQVEQAGLSIQKNWAGVNSVFKSAGSTLTSGKGLKASLDELGDGGIFASASAAKFADAATGLVTFGLAGTHLADVYKTNEGTFDAMGQQLAGLAKTNYSAASTSFRNLATSQHLSADETKNLLHNMPAYREELVTLAGKAHVAATDSNLLAIAQGKGAVSSKVAAQASRDAAAAADKQASELAKLTGSGDDATTSMKSLHDALANLGSTELDARSAARAFQQAIDDATAAAKKNGKTLDTNTQAGRDNAAALDNIASTADAAAAAYVANGGSAAGAAKKIAAGRAAYVKQAESMGLSKAAANKLADAMHLIPKDIASVIKVSGGDAAKSMLATVQAQLAKLNGTTAQVYVNAQLQGGANVSAALLATGRAAGGGIDGPGPKGKDSVLTVLAPGEHVLTAGDVDKMGGQSNVYAFRSALHMATGGAVGDAASKEAAYKRQAAADQRALTAAKKAATAAAHAATRASNVHDKAADAAANMDGTGSKAKAAAKKAAERNVRDLQNKADAAKKASDAAQKKADDLSTKLDTAKQNQSDQADRLTTLQQASQDFSMSMVAGDYASDPDSAVSAALSMSRDSNYTAPERSALNKAAVTTQKTLVRLEAAATSAATAVDDASSKLSDLKSTSDSLASSVASSLSGSTSFSDASSVAAAAAAAADTARAAAAPTASGWVTRNGIRMQTYTAADTTASSTDPTAGGVTDYFNKQSAATSAFATQLRQLAGRGLNAALLAQLAQMGVADGSKMAAALLSASGDQLSAINSDYANIGSVSASAGQFIADDNYAGLINAAQAQLDAANANATAIQGSITAATNSIVKVLASAYGLKGYATGTSYATAGLHMVGENGPELVRFNGGEGVMTASATKSYIRGGGAAAARQQVVVKAPVINYPSTITVQDVHGFTATMQVIADQRIAVDAQQDSVLELGGAA